MDFFGSNLFCIAKKEKREKKTPEWNRVYIDHRDIGIHILLIACHNS